MSRAHTSASAFVLGLLALVAVGNGCGASDVPIGDDTSNGALRSRDAGQSCGGFAGLSCPTNQACVDDPNDNCNPAKGGADCPGVCVAETDGGANADGGQGNSDASIDAGPPLTCGGLHGTACPNGFTCADDPSDNCDPAQGGADCPGICVEDSATDGGPAPQSCGGFSGLPCPSGKSCVDKPDDGCDPAQGGADCPGICI